MHRRPQSMEDSDNMEIDENFQKLKKNRKYIGIPREGVGRTKGRKTLESVEDYFMHKNCKRSKELLEKWKMLKNKEC